MVDANGDFSGLPEKRGRVTIEICNNSVELEGSKGYYCCKPCEFACLQSRIVGGVIFRLCSDPYHLLHSAEQILQKEGLVAVAG